MPTFLTHKNHRCSLKRRHVLIDMVVIAGTLCGAEGWVKITHVRARQAGVAGAVFGVAQ